MKTKLTMATLALGLFLAPMAQAQNQMVIDHHIQIRQNVDSEWIMGSAQGSLMEVALGRLAVTKAATMPTVVDFANRMITDHTGAYDELKALAQRKRTAFPAAMSPDQMLIVNFFTNSTSADWAKDYVKFEIEDHKKCIDETKKEIASGRDVDVKAQATKMLPILEAHLKMAMDLDASL